MSQGRFNKPFVRDSVLEDIQTLKHSLREADRIEMADLYGYSPEQGLCISYGNSKKVFTACDSTGYALAMFGVGLTTDSSIGAPWLLCSNEFRHYHKSFIKECRKYVDLFYELYPVLLNLIDCRNYQAIRWLKWCGFEITGEIILVGKNKAPFTRFIGKKKN